MPEAIEGVVSEGEGQEEFQGTPDRRALVEWFQPLYEVREVSTASHIRYRHDGEGWGENAACDAMTNGEHPHWFRAIEVEDVHMYIQAWGITLSCSPSTFYFGDHG